MKVASFEAIVRALNDAKVPFIVVGGIAVNTHGYGPFNFEEEYRSALLVESSPGLFTRIVQYKTLLRMKSEASRSRDLADISELRLLHEGKYPNA